MSDKIKKKSQIKSRLHIRNRNRERYDLEGLIKTCPDLSQFVKPNKHNEKSIDFSNPDAVKALNKALLSHYYGISDWEIPTDYLCPPIPGRADYLHNIADLLCESNYGKIPTGEKITCFDIGVGANCIYPILGVVEYGWNFIGSDIDKKAIKYAEKIVSSNSILTNKVDLRLQEDAKDIFYGAVLKEEKIDISICNPPFHSSEKEALESSAKKVQNLTGDKNAEVKRNFGGKNNELWCDGGEYKFISTMVSQSKKFSQNCFWFSTLVSKQSNLKSINKALELAEATLIEIIPMGTGNKVSRIVAWSFLTKDQRRDWRDARWSSKKKSK